MNHFDIAANMTNMYNKVEISILYRIDRNHILEKICLQIIKVALLPAQKMFFQVCAKIVENIKEIIHSDNFLSRHRFSEKDFTRDRKLPFSRLIYHFINFNKRAYQDELDAFFKLINNLEIDEREVTKGALNSPAKAETRSFHRAEPAPECAILFAFRNKNLERI